VRVKPRRATRREPLAELRREFDRIKAVTDALDDVVYSVDSRGQIALRRRACRALLGKAPEELLGRPATSSFS
jgi:PAS domain-containing protein